MTRRLATIFLMTVFLIGFCCSPVQAQGHEPTTATLKGIAAVGVAVEDLPDGAKVLGLTKEDIQSDVELKLRLAGMLVVTLEEAYKLPGKPYLNVRVGLTRNARAASIAVELKQNVVLERDGQSALSLATWAAGGVASNATAHDIRDWIKDKVDLFLNDWLSVNPKK